MQGGYQPIISADHGQKKPEGNVGIYTGKKLLMLQKQKSNEKVRLRWWRRLIWQLTL